MDHTAYIFPSECYAGGKSGRGGPIDRPAPIAVKGIMSGSAKIEHDKANGEYHMNPLVKDGDPVDEDESRRILLDWGISPKRVNQIIEWFDAYGDLKDEIWSHQD